MVLRFLLGAAMTLAILADALPATAQNPGSFDARAEYLLRRMDQGLLPTPMLIAMLRDPYPETRILAVRVVASSSDPSQTILLARYLRDRDLRVRYEVMIAAGRLGPAGRELAFKGLRDVTPKVRQAAAWAACHGGPEGLDPLMEILKAESDDGVRATAMANLWRFEGAGWESFASTAAAGEEVQLRRAAAFSLGRSERQSSRAALRRLATDSVAVIRATAVAGLGRAALVKDDVMVLQQAMEDSDRRVRMAACAALARQVEPELDQESAALVASIWAADDPQLAVMALRAAGARPEIGDDTDLLEILGSEEPWLASEAFTALAARSGVSDQLVSEWFSREDLWRRKTVASVVPALGEVWEKAVSADADAAVRLVYLEHLDAEQVAERLGVLGRMVRQDPDPLVRTAALNHLSDAGAAGDFDTLINLARSWQSDEVPDARAAALASALAATEDDDLRATVVNRAVNDRDPAVAILVINAARSLGLPARSHERDLRHNGRWYVELVEWMKESHWLDVVTDRGSFRIHLDSMEAPISSREIYDLAAAGFYDGLNFHRVVPNFVVQGGDPLGNGWGGPGFTLPDEPGFRPFDAWRVGIATSGPNTGGSQLFITLMPTDHLTGHYTNLGAVVAGRDVLTRLRVGDQIRRIEAFSGDEPPPPAPTLIGAVDWYELAEIPGWQDEYDAGQPDPAAVERLATATGSYRIVTVLGSWCHDSQREVPRLVKVLDQIGGPVFSHEMIGVDRTRRIDDATLAAFAGVERTVERVATIVVLDVDGVELGRVIETAERPIEELLVEFIAPREGW